jgi:hypothetical protein
LLEARTRKEEGLSGESVLTSHANGANNATLDASGMAQIGRTQAEQLELFRSTVNKHQMDREAEAKARIARDSQILGYIHEVTDAYLTPRKRRDSLRPNLAPPLPRKKAEEFARGVARVRRRVGPQLSTTPASGDDEMEEED